MIMKKRTLIMAVAALAAVFATSCHKDNKDDAGVSFRDFAPVLKDMGMAVTEIFDGKTTTTIQYDNGRMSQYFDGEDGMKVSWTNSGCTLQGLGSDSEMLSYSLADNILTMKMPGGDGTSIVAEVVLTFDGKRIVEVSLGGGAEVTRYTWEDGNLVRAVTMSAASDGTMTTDNEFEYTYSDDVLQWDGFGLIQLFVLDTGVPGLNMFPVRNIPTGFVDHGKKTVTYHSYDYELDSKGRITKFTDTWYNSPDESPRINEYTLKYGLK